MDTLILTKIQQPNNSELHSMSSSICRYVKSIAMFLNIRKKVEKNVLDVFVAGDKAAHNLWKV